MGVQNYTMAFRIFISLVLASTVTSIELGCGDYSYNICHDPPANQELHVGSLEECIQNCDLFATFDQCDYLLYWETGPDENCKIISGPGSAKEEMDKYLNACGVIGQPITNDGTTGGTCIEGPNNECAATCLTYCTLNQQSNPWQYVAYDQESKECICYEKPDHTCSVQVVIQGMTIEEANACHM